MTRDSDDLRLQLEAAIQKLARTQKRIDQSDDCPHPGDLYAFRETAVEGIEWVAILQNREDVDLWFTVPFDQNPMVGTWDVEVSSFSDSGPGTLRCGRGIWIHAKDLVLTDRSGFLETHDVEHARARLAAMVGEDVPVTFQPHVDDDPDYQEWLDELSRAAERLQSRFRTCVSVVKLADFDTSWTSTLGVHASTPVSLAADTGGLGAGPSETVQPVVGTIVAQGLPGVLVAVQNEEGIRLMYHVANSEEPPAVQVFLHDTEHKVTWRQLSDVVLESQESFAVIATVSIDIDGRRRCVIDT